MQTSYLKIDSISQNDTINLKKTLMFICMPKINFIIHFFLEILYEMNTTIWLANSILVHNLRTRMFPNIWLGEKYQ